MSRGTIKKIAGPLVIAKGMRDANMFDVVRVSDQRLIGEIIEMHEDEASIQVYEETSGLRPGEPVESMEVPLSVELGPGLITSIYDGIQRPLDDIMKVAGSNNLKRGVEVPALKRDKKWNFVPVAKVGDELEGGDVLGTVQETIVVTQKIMVPPNMKGTLKEIKSGEFTVDETVAVLSTANGDKELTLMQVLDRVLRLLSMGSKRFLWILTSKMGRSVTGFVAQAVLRPAAPAAERRGGACAESLLHDGLCDGPQRITHE